MDELHASSVCEPEQTAFLAEDLLALFMKQQCKDSDSSHWQSDRFNTCPARLKPFNASLRGEKSTDTGAASIGRISDLKSEQCELDVECGSRMSAEMASPCNVYMTATEIVTSCKDQSKFIHSLEVSTLNLSL